MTRHKNRRNRRGNSMIEFALVGMILVPLFLGTINVGFTLGRSVQVQQIARDAGHMYVRKVDFSLAKNRQFIVRLGAGLGLQDGAGDGNLVLTTIQLISKDECDAAGLSGACPNKSKVVVTERINIGNTAKFVSSLASPDPAIVQANGKISAANYLTHASVVIPDFDKKVLKGMKDGEVAFISEAFFEFPEWFLSQSYANKSVYARNIF